MSVTVFPVPHVLAHLSCAISPTLFLPLVNNAANYQTVSFDAYKMLNGMAIKLHYYHWAGETFPT
jgi:hypothetical protein